GPVNAQNGYVRGNILVLENVCLTILQIFGGDSFHGRSLGNAVDIEERSKSHTDTYGYGQVGQYSQSKRCDPDGDVGFRQTNNSSNFPPLSHVVSHDEQHRGKSCQRNKPGQGSS